MKAIGPPPSTRRSGSPAGPIFQGNADRAIFVGIGLDGRRGSLRLGFSRRGCRRCRGFWAERSRLELESLAASSSRGSNAARGPSAKSPCRRSSIPGILKGIHHREQQIEGSRSPGFPNPRSRSSGSPPHGGRPARSPGYWPPAMRLELWAVRNNRWMHSLRCSSRPLFSSTSRSSFKDCMRSSSSPRNVARNCDVKFFSSMA